MVRRWKKENWIGRRPVAEREREGGGELVEGLALLALRAVVRPAAKEGGFNGVAAKAATTRNTRRGGGLVRGDVWASRGGEITVVLQLANGWASRLAGGGQRWGGGAGEAASGCGATTEGRRLTEVAWWGVGAEGGAREGCGGGGWSGSGGQAMVRPTHDTSHALVAHGRRRWGTGEGRWAGPGREGDWAERRGKGLGAAWVGLIPFLISKFLFLHLNQNKRK